MESESIDYTDPTIKVNSTLNKKFHQSPKRKIHFISGGAKKTHFNVSSPPSSSGNIKQQSSYGDDVDVSLNTSTSSVLSSNFGDQKDNIMIYKHCSDRNETNGDYNSSSSSLFFSPNIKDGNMLRGSDGEGSQVFDAMPRSNMDPTDNHSLRHHHSHADGSMTTDREDMTNSFSNSFLSSSGESQSLMRSNGSSSHMTTTANPKSSSSSSSSSSYTFHHQPLEDSISRVMSSVTTPIASPLMGFSAPFPSNYNRSDLSKRSNYRKNGDLSVDGLNINTTNSIIDETALSSISPVSSPGVNNCFVRSSDEYEVPATNGGNIAVKVSDYSPQRKNKNNNENHTSNSKNIFNLDGHDLASSIPKINILNNSFEKEKKINELKKNKSGSTQNGFKSIDNSAGNHLNSSHAADCEWRSSCDDSDNDDNEEIITSSCRGGTRLRFTPLGFNLDAPNDVMLQNESNTNSISMDRCSSRNSNGSSSSANRMDTEEMNVFYEVGMAGRMSGLHVGKKSSKNNNSNGEIISTGNIHSDNKNALDNNDRLSYDSDGNDDSEFRLSYNSRVKVRSPVRVNGSMSFMEAISVVSDNVSGNLSAVKHNNSLSLNNQSSSSAAATVAVPQPSKRIVENNTIDSSSNGMAGSMLPLPNLFDYLPGVQNNPRIRALSFDGYTRRSPSYTLNDSGDDFIITSPRSPTMMNVVNSESSLNNVDLTPLVSNGADSPTDIGAYNHFNDNQGGSFSAHKSSINGFSGRRNRRSVVNSENSLNIDSSLRGDNNRRRKSGSSIFNNSLSSVGSSIGSLSNTPFTDINNGIAHNSNTNVSDNIRPLPDQSAFEKSSNTGHIMSPTQQQDPVCPATPMRTPNWIHENSNNSIIIDNSDPLRSLQSDLLFNGPSLARVNSLSSNKVLCDNNVPNSFDCQIDVNSSIFDSDNDISLRKSVHSSLIFHRDFENLGLLGSGTFADVFKVQAKDDGKFYAVKKSRRQFRSKKEREWLLKEVQIMKTIGVSYCKYVVQLIKAWQENGYFYAQIGLAEKGTVKELMLAISSGGGSKNVMHFPDSTVFRIVHDVSAGLNHMHSMKFVHLDIKPANLLIDYDGVIKIGDFGMATEEGSGEDGHEGDSRYMAPELLNSSLRMPPADVFSLGLTLYEICMLNTQTALNYQLEGIYEIPSEGQFWHDVREGNVLPLTGRSSQLTDIIYSAMIPAPSSRPSTSSISSLPHVMAAKDPSSDPILSSNQNGFAVSRNNSSSNLSVNLSASAIAGTFSKNLPPLQSRHGSSNATKSFLALQQPTGTGLFVDSTAAEMTSNGNGLLDRVTTPTNQVLSGYNQWKHVFPPNNNNNYQHNQH